jgi:hypothetical protein
MVSIADPRQGSRVASDPDILTSVQALARTIPAA